MPSELPPMVGCVVVTLRENDDRLLLKSADGDIQIEVHPISMSRAKVVVRAPKSVEVRRQKAGDE